MRHWLAACLLLVACQTVADERILEFRSDVLVMPDGWIEVTETISVRAEGQRIKRGIYRDFPTEYHDTFGNNYVVDFKPLSVLRDGASEDFHTKDYMNGTRVYFGHEDRFLKSGEYTYAFRYRASRMLGFFEHHDELYCNVTGFDWAFPIDLVVATVEFGFDVPVDQVTHEAYT
ncbi:MAG: DUF2207 domain-containing protein, partial [Gammaproteobacteria bacterium]|nr:DUF2207 domain-containing protein [Gammaproteobacteria bacterium]